MYAALLVASYAAGQAQALPANLTIISGTIYHGDGLLCSPTHWYNVVVFFIGNYLAHAATVKSYPGERTSSLMIASAGALLIPTTGLIRGINSIARNAKFKRKSFWRAVWRDTDYQTAAAAGAFCMVVRKKSWKPYPGDKLLNVVLRDEVEELPYSQWQKRKRAFMKSNGIPQFFEVKPVPHRGVPENVRQTPRTLKIYRPPWAQERGRYWMYTDTCEEYVHPGKSIHGFCDFKDQAWSYALAHVPRDALIEIRGHPGELDLRCLKSAATGRSQSTSACDSASLYASPPRGTTGSPVVGASYSIPKTVIAIAQIIYAVVTLFQSRGNQIDTFGYAAFGLTVIPYALMSLINLIGSLVTPDYHALHLVASDVMDEAIRRGACFDGVVGRLVPETEDALATAEVLSVNTEEGIRHGLSDRDEEKTNGIMMSYCHKDRRDIFPASVVDYSSPSLSVPKRRKFVKKRIESISKDLSPSTFVPSCSKFRRLTSHDYTIDVNRTQMTHQGSFSFTHTVPSTIYRSTASFVNALVILAIVGAMTKFKNGSATVEQCNWIMNWYVFGAIYSGFSMEDFLRARAWPEPDWGIFVKRSSWIMILPCVLYGVPACGGFVTVVQMLLQYGTCTSA